MTQVGYVSWFGFPFHTPRTLITSGFSGTLGAGFPTALGVKVAWPNRPVVAVSGDGGFLFGGSDLATAVRHGINLVTVVFNKATPKDYRFRSALSVRSYNSILDGMCRP